MQEPNAFLGRTIDGYRLVSVLGTNRRGAVILGENPAFNLPRVAFQVIAPPPIKQIKHFRDRFAQVVHLLTSMKHPHILPLLASGEDRATGYFYIASPYCDGGTLAQRIDGEPIRLEEVEHILSAIASALDYAHQHGVMHRNVKPNNIRFTSDGKIFLTDFGNVDLYEAEMTDEKDAKRSIGTPDYMSPEQVQGKRVGPESDNFSLAIITYQLVTGHLPFPGPGLAQRLYQLTTGEPPAPRSYNPALPIALEVVLARSLAKNPQDRYPTATQFADAFQTAAQGGRGEGSPPRDDASASSLVGMSTAILRPDSLGGRGRTGGRVPIAAPASTPFVVPIVPGARWSRERVANFAARNRPLLGAALAVVVVLALTLTILGFGRQGAKQQANISTTPRPGVTTTASVSPNGTAIVSLTGTTTPGTPPPATPIPGTTTPSATGLPTTAATATSVPPTATSAPSGPPGFACTPGSGNDWQSFGHDVCHSFYSAVNVGGTPNKQWQANPGNEISSQVIAANGALYFGTWDGNFHATDLNGNTKWQKFLGQHPTGKCGWYQVALAGSPVFTTAGGVTAVVVAGGDGKLHALDANSGNEKWASQIEDIYGGEYVWGSLIAYNGSIYAGIASFDDCSRAIGKIVRVSANDGGIQASYSVASSACPGGGIWSTPSIDPNNGILYATTGNIMPGIPGNCDTSRMQAIIALNASSLNFIATWTVPGGDLNNVDSDFGGTPTLFNAGNRTLLGVINKNGTYYVLDRNNFGAGVIWRFQVADGGTDPQGGQGSIATSAFDGQRIYVAGGRSGGCAGTLRALDPATGQQLWTQCLGGTVLGAVTAANGNVFITDGNSVEGFRSDSGTRFFSFSSNTYYSAVTIVPNHLYIGDTKGNLFGFGW